MAIKLNVKSVNIIWHILPFQLRPDAVGATSRRIARYVATYRQLRRHVSPATSGRSWWCVPTQFWGGRLIRGILFGSLKSEKVTRHSSLFIFFRFSVVLLEAYRKKGV